LINTELFYRTTSVILNFAEKKMVSIQIEGMRFHAFHGHYPVEQLVGSDFIVDLKIQVQESKALKTDDLSDAINYQILYGIVKEEMQITSSLLEHVGNRILKAVYNKFPEIDNSEVKISKLNPPMGGEIDKVCVMISK